MKMISVNRFI